MDRSACCRTMFSMPLANPSTLDRRPASALTWGRRPTWRGAGARASTRGLIVIRRRKLMLIRSVNYAGLRERVFLSQAGPRFGTRASSSWASPFGCGARSTAETTKATSWVALAISTMRLFSAHRLVCEGRLIAEQADGPVDRMPARRGRRGPGRFGKVWTGIE